jgi:enoyl-[acyl-carrier protein] reductase / trans-2-enoyl-CoA reductase (NAD+)
MRMAPATEKEIADTVAVMGGEDLRWWVDVLRQRGLLAPGCRCLALSYVGVPPLRATYRGGTLGAAKNDLERTVREVDGELRGRGAGTAATPVIRPLVTQASLAIPMNLLYTMLMEKVLEELGAGEDALDQGIRLVRTADPESVQLDGQCRVRLDDAEQREDVQREIWSRWARVTTATVGELAAVEAVERQRRQLYGFDVAGVDYAADVNLVTDSDRIEFT